MNADAAQPTIRDRLDAALVSAMRRRDREQCDVLRTTLGAIDNAQAVDVAGHELEVDPDSAFAGAVSGLGGTEVKRRSMTEAEVADVVRSEIGELLDAAQVYAEAGKTERAEMLRGQAATLGAVLDG